MFKLKFSRVAGMEKKDSNKMKLTIGFGIWIQKNNFEQPHENNLQKFVIFNFKHIDFIYFINVKIGVKTKPEINLFSDEKIISLSLICIF